MTVTTLLRYMASTVATIITIIILLLLLSLLFLLLFYSLYLYNIIHHYITEICLTEAGNNWPLTMASTSKADWLSLLRDG